MNPIYYVIEVRNRRPALVVASDYAARGTSHQEALEQLASGEAVVSNDDAIVISCPEIGPTGEGVPNVVRVIHEHAGSPHWDPVGSYWGAVFAQRAVELPMDSLHLVASKVARALSDIATHDGTPAGRYHGTDQAVVTALECVVAVLSALAGRGLSQFEAPGSRTRLSAEGKNAEGNRRRRAGATTGHRGHFRDLIAAEINLPAVQAAMARVRS